MFQGRRPIYNTYRAKSRPFCYYASKRPDNISQISAACSRPVGLWCWLENPWSSICDPSLHTELPENRPSVFVANFLHTFAAFLDSLKRHFLHWTELSLSLYYCGNVIHKPPWQKCNHLSTLKKSRNERFCFLISRLYNKHWWWRGQM